jgi:hypothetical protein
MAAPEEMNEPIVSDGVRHPYGRLQIGEQAISVLAEPLQRHIDATPGTVHDASPEPDAAAIAIYAWLQEELPNPQALHPLRLGIARLARQVGSGLRVPGASRPSSVRLTRTGNGTCPPVHIEGIDRTDGIRVGHWIGDVAYDVARLARADTRTANSLTRRILANPSIAPLIWEILRAEERSRTEVDEALGVPLTRFVAKARRLAALAWGPS